MDDVLVKNGTGAGTDFTVRTDDDGTGHWQLFKIGYGADGVFTRVTTAVGLPVEPGRCATATLSSVNDSASSQSLLASNTARKGAIFFNDSPSYLYLKFGATASTTSFSYKIDPYGTLELPSPIYTGAIDGIWSADASGACRITELTA